MRHKPSFIQKTWIVFCGVRYTRGLGRECHISLKVDMAVSVLTIHMERRRLSFLSKTLTICQKQLSVNHSSFKTRKWLTNFLKWLHFFFWKFFRPPHDQSGGVPYQSGAPYFYERHYQVGTQSLPRSEVEPLLCQFEWFHASRQATPWVLHPSYVWHIGKTDGTPRWLSI